jgi:hypothetical protein
VWIKRFGIYENRRNRENHRKIVGKAQKRTKMQEMQEYREVNHMT